MDVAIAGEGPIDVAVMRRLLSEAAIDAGPVHWGIGRNTGKQGLMHRLRGYAEGARHGTGFLVLCDLDRDADCAPAFLAGRIDDPPPGLCLRVAVPMVEAWLVADGGALARHLSVPEGRFRVNPDAHENPKRLIVDAGARSRKRAIRDGMRPRPGSGRAEGPDYADIIMGFVAGPWSPARAAEASDSLARTRRALIRFRDRRGPA